MEVVLPSPTHNLPTSGRCWSTFIYRTTGLRAVEDFISKVLLTLVGLSYFRTALHPSFIYKLIIIYNCLIFNYYWKFSSNFFNSAATNLTPSMASASYLAYLAARSVKYASPSADHFAISSARLRRL